MKANDAHVTVVKYQVVYQWRYRPCSDILNGPLCHELSMSPSIFNKNAIAVFETTQVYGDFGDISTLFLDFFRKKMRKIIRWKQKIILQTFTQ